MFERIKCYRTLKKMDELNEYAKKVGKSTENYEMYVLADEALKNNASIRKRIIFNRKLAARYNKEFKNAFLEGIQNFFNK